MLAVIPSARSPGRLVPVWAFLAGHHPGLRTSVQNPCIQSGLASNRLVLCTASDEVPNSISNHTLQAMLTQAVVKRYRQAIDEVAEEYVCPITAELPIDPVTAEDGRCYERHAIEEWFSRQPQPQVKSPVTNEPMGKRLFPAVQVRNSLKRLVESGAISGSKADAWKQAVAEEAEVVALRAEAEGGNAESMCALAHRYDAGTHGLRQDFAQSFKWFKRAADLKHVSGLTNCGVAYLNGEGVEQNGTRGIAMLGAAAALGSEHACAILGYANAEGDHGFDEDPQEATRWYREMQKCGHRDSNATFRERAADLAPRAPVEACQEPEEQAASAATGLSSETHARIPGIPHAAYFNWPL